MNKLLPYSAILLVIPLVSSAEEANLEDHGLPLQGGHQRRGGSVQQ